MADNLAFHDPCNGGHWDISTSQVNKTIVFDCSPDENPSGLTFSPNAVIVFRGKCKEVFRYTVGNGIELSSSDQVATLTLQGSDFLKSAGRKLTGYASLINDGDVEVTLELSIIKSHL